MSRRSLLRAFGAGAAGATLAGCGVPAAFVEPGDRAGRDSSATDHTLHFANWPLC
ncbi:spermidine/putrescine ABC transporter substrate-binding protein, partial [Streptomyces anulatus]